MKKGLAAGAVSGLVFVLPVAAFAQDDKPSTYSGEIVVTAQRRAETLTSVPLSISAASGEMLQAKGLEAITDLRFETPGFISLSGTGYTQLYIRGIGNNIFVGADPSVATFIDDVPRVYGSLVDNFINVERVEVLKGAQGGLYGRNATGGVINIITRQPGDEMKMQARVTVAEYESVDASAYLNIPLAPGAAANFSVNRRYRHGYLRNIAPARPYPPGTTSFFGDPNTPVTVRPLNNADFYAFDGKLRFEPTDALKITFAGDYARKQDADGNGWVQQEVTRNYLVYRGYAAAAGISNPLAPWPKPDRHSAYGAIDSFSWTEDYGASAKADLGLGELDLTSITALRWNNSNFRGDIGAAPVPMAGFFTDFNRHNFYQELRAVSSGSGPLQYLAGATYYKDKIDSILRPLFVGFPQADTVSTVRTENYSVYGQLTYDISNLITVSGSLRYVSEKKRAFFPAQRGFGEARVNTKQSKLLPSATVTLHLGEGILYARYARGFKTGGVNPIVHPEPFRGAPGSEFGPETVDSLEAGYRASLFERRVQFTSAVFYNKYKGIQIARAGNAANAAISNAIIDAGTARTYGAEATLTWQITPELSVSGNIGYLNAKYLNARYPGSPIVDPFDASGNVMSLAPKWQGGASVNLDQPIGSNLKIKANALVSFISRYNYQYEENPFLWQNAYQVVNVRAGVGDRDDHITGYFFVNNLFDEYYTIFGTSNSLGSLLTPAPPRVIGGTLEVKF